MSRTITTLKTTARYNDPAPDFVFPKGYRPKKQPDGVFIGDLDLGDKFIAPDECLYKVSRPVKTVRCAGGVAEYDMWAKGPSGTEYHFHAPVGANPDKFTFRKP